MVWRAVRQLAKNGNSYTVALPGVVRARMRVLKGDWLDLTFDEDTETLTIKARNNRETGPEMPSRLIGITVGPS